MIVRGDVPIIGSRLLYYEHVYAYFTIMSDHVQAVTHDLLVRELCRVTEWDVLGIYLGLDESEITEIERDNQSNARRRIAMLAKWMEKDVDASWKKMTDALE